MIEIFFFFIMSFYYMSGKSSKPDDDGIMNPAESDIMKSGIWVRQSCDVCFYEVQIKMIAKAWSGVVK